MGVVVKNGWGLHRSTLPVAKRNSTRRMLLYSGNAYFWGSPLEKPNEPHPTTGLEKIRKRKAIAKGNRAIPRQGCNRKLLSSSNAKRSISDPQNDLEGIRLPNPTKLLCLSPEQCMWTIYIREIS